MGNKFFRSILIVISFLAASVGLASCGNTYTPSYDNLSFAVISEEEKICEVNGYKKYYNDERDNNIYIPKIWNDYKVTSIGESAFFGCESLSSIVIPNSVTSIGEFAFLGCSSLSDVYYIGSKEQWNAISIDSNNVELKSATIHYNYMG